MSKEISQLFVKTYRDIVAVEWKLEGLLKSAAARKSAMGDELIDLAFCLSKVREQIGPIVFEANQRVLGLAREEQERRACLEAEGKVWRMERHPSYFGPKDFYLDGEGGVVKVTGERVEVVPYENYHCTIA